MLAENVWEFERHEGGGIVHAASGLFFGILLAGATIAQPSSAKPRSAQSDRAEPVGEQRNLKIMLDSARTHLAAYLPLLPNVIGTETGHSVEFQGNRQKRDIRFTAHIRMVHAPMPDAPDRVTEQMEFLTRNGKPVGRRQADVPFYLVDIFTNQNPQILPAPDRCIAYLLRPSAPGTIQIERWIHPQSPMFAAACADNPDVNIGEKVEITLDAATMQMIALDRPLQPRRDLHRGEQLAYHYEYAPQKLGAMTTLLPARLHAELVSADSKTRKVFDASYSDYHRYGSTATVLPAP